MAFDRTALVEAVAGRLHLHGYHPSDVGMLFAVARFENQKVRQILGSKDVPADSPAWHQTYCRAGAPRLAFERGISVSQARASLARIEHDGLIDVIHRGRSAPPLRRIKVEAMNILERAGSSRLLFEHVKKDKSFNLGSLDWLGFEEAVPQRRWTNYLREDDVQPTDCLTAEEIALVLERPEKLYFGSTLLRDRCLWACKNLYKEPFTFERGSDKPSRNKHARRTPYLIVRHPDGLGEIQIAGEPAADADPDLESDSESDLGDETEVCLAID